ncbi:MAG: tetratricopeptide repeat protein [Nitrospira sp.]|nr:tetratricopeptide repeat protein [Nitrospira sp.]MDH4249999.1 tetratricopeptide repeat protein [Nitrospira sp.]MDH4344350.1 tetratricopeptide repeat protein [Nitrospira sp.]MDH5337954.1 tetratricopeptide repeat protein [Nitrospira sp.]
MPQQMSSADLYERGFVLMALRMFHPAIDDFQTAATDARYAGKAYVPMAMCLRALGRHEEAVAALRRAITSPMASPVEQRHILYHLGRMLESLGRWVETLEVYGWISKGDPGFRDVAQRVKYVSSSKGRLYSRFRDWWGALVNGVCTRGRALPPHILTVLGQTGQWAGWPVETCRHPDRSGISRSLSSDEAVGIYAQSDSPSRRMRGQEKRAS